MGATKLRLITRLLARPEQSADAKETHLSNFVLIISTQKIECTPLTQESSTRHCLCHVDTNLAFQLFLKHVGKSQNVHTTDWLKVLKRTNAIDKCDNVEYSQELGQTTQHSLWTPDRSIRMRQRRTSVSRGRCSEAGSVPACKERLCAPRRHFTEINEAEEGCTRVTFAFRCTVHTTFGWNRSKRCWNVRRRRACRASESRQRHPCPEKLTSLRNDRTTEGFGKKASVSSTLELKQPCQRH